MFGYAFIFFSIIYYSHCKSFTIVLDTTVSMKEELNVIKANIGQAFSSQNSTFENYILVPFKDTNIDHPSIYNEPKDLITHLNTLSTSGGHECPENSLAGIETAIKYSKEESYVFIFTDAYAKDYNRLDTIQKLCQENHAQVIIFLSGFCLPSSNIETGSVVVYYDIVKSCSGLLFKFDNTNELRQAFKFMNGITNTAWTDISAPEEFNDFHQLTVNVDSFTTDFWMVVTGDYPEITLFKDYQAVNLETILDTRHALVARLAKIEPGTYTIKVRGHGTNILKMYERHILPFQYGFSTRSPNELRETSLRPMAGWNNFILIETETSIDLYEVEWLTYGENTKKILYLERKRPGIYVTSIFVEPGKNFKFWIKGRNTDTYQDIKGSTKLLIPQTKETNPKWSKPTSEIFEPATNLIDFGQNLTLICKVKGYPKPNITWETEDNNLIPSEDVLLEIPNVYLSYATLANASKNTTIYCKCQNTEGDDMASVDVFVNRTFTFNVIRYPEDTSVEFGEELRLYCEIDAYPEASVKWYLNKTEILSTANIDGHALVINNVGLSDNGLYECEVKNGVEAKTFQAIVNVTGIEAPVIDKGDTELSLKPGDWTELHCRVTKGKPYPDISWKFKSFDNFSFDDLPFGTEVDEGVIKIRSVEKKHGGIYKCIAKNVVGEDTKDVVVKIQYAPIIKENKDENITVREDDHVKLPCNVESSPNAVVRWEMSQDDVIIAFDDRHKTDEWNSHIFIARSNDSGNYHCIAENNVGRAERTVFVNVLVSPYIEAPKSEIVNAAAGTDVTLPCNVLYGNPAPVTKWEFIAKNTPPRIIRSDSSTLHLTRVTRYNEGTYLCIAENSIDRDRIRYQLKIH